MSAVVSFAHRKAWTANARRIGRRWRDYAGLVSVAAVVIAVIAVVPHLSIKQYLIGAVVGSIAAMVAIAMARFDDPVMRGDVAEQWTSEVFGKLHWPTVNNLSFPDGDVDHLVAAPCGVLAVETKYRYSQSDALRLSAQRRRDVEAVQRAARKSASVLRSKDVRHDATVTPVLIVWGPGSPDLPDGYKLTDTGVYVLDANHSGLWSHLFSAPRLRKDERISLADSLRRFQRKQIDHAAGRTTSLRRECWNEFRTGVRENASERLDRKRRRQSLRRRHSARRSAAPATSSGHADH